MLEVIDHIYDESTSPAAPFGYLDGQEFYAEFDTVPFNGICDKRGQPGTVAELPYMDFFGDTCAPVSDELAALCETNKTYDYTPVANISSSEFKEINDATRTYEGKFQAYAKKVLILGCGANPLTSTFDFSKSEVWYVDASGSNIMELKRRLAEMKKRPNKCKFKVGDFARLFPYLHTMRFDLIVANNSLHYICEGPLDRQRSQMRKVLQLLSDKGALCGVGPSLSGLMSTPITNEIRKGHGLFGISSGACPVATSSLGGLRCNDPVLHPEILLSLELEFEGKAEFTHLSTFASGNADADLIRCYEAFSFVKKKNQRPSQITVSEVSGNVNRKPHTKFSWSIAKKEPLAVNVRPSSKRDIGEDRTYATLLQTQHTPKLLYQSPMLVSTKLDGQLGELVYDGSEWILSTEHSSFVVDIEKPKVRKGVKRVDNVRRYSVEVFNQGGAVYIWWLETLFDRHRPLSWLGGFWRVPKELGVKRYSDLSTANFCAALKEPQSDGVVILNPFDRPGGQKPKQMLFKPRVSVDVSLNGKVYELFRDKIVPRDHEANGSLRVFESPFLFNDRCIISLITERCSKYDQAPTHDGEREGISLDAVIGFPSLCGSLGQTRARNTALVQLWRGRFSCDSMLVNLMAPLGRHPDWGLFGVLADSMLAGGYDKDGIIQKDAFQISESGFSVDAYNNDAMEMLTSGGVEINGDVELFL